MLNCGHGLTSDQFSNILHSRPLDLANILDLRKMRCLGRWTKSAGNLSLVLIGWYYESHCAKLGESFFHVDSWKLSLIAGGTSDVAESEMVGAEFDILEDVEFG